MPCSQHDAAMSVVQQRRVLVEHVPSLPCGDRRQDATALDKSGGRRREHTLPPFEWLEHPSLHITRRLRRPRSCGEFLHHHGAQVRERKRAVEKREHLRLRGLVPESIDEDVRIERVFHAFRRRSRTSSMPPLLRTAANPRASSSRKATRLRAWSIASVSVSTPKARRAMSNFRWSITTFFRTQPARLLEARGRALPTERFATTDLAIRSPSESSV